MKRNFPETVMPPADMPSFPRRRESIAAIVLCIAIGKPSWAYANQSSESALPTELANSLPAVELVGKGKLTFFGLEVYESSLWTTPSFKGLSFENHSFALELHYLRNFTAADIAKRSIEEMQRIEPVPEQKVALWIKTLSEAFPNVKKGDRIVGVHKPSFGVTFWHNGKRSGEIRDADFSRQFFGIWLSPKTSEPKLRQALLGKVNL
jgi:Chalcone isomerase-like